MNLGASLSPCFEPWPSAGPLPRRWRSHSTDPAVTHRWAIWSTWMRA